MGVGQRGKEQPKDRVAACTRIEAASRQLNGYASFSSTASALSGYLLNLVDMGRSFFRCGLPPYPTVSRVRRAKIGSRRCNWASRGWQATLADLRLTELGPKSSRSIKSIPTVPAWHAAETLPPRSAVGGAWCVVFVDQRSIDSCALPHCSPKLPTSAAWSTRTSSHLCIPSREANDALANARPPAGGYVRRQRRASAGGGKARCNAPGERS